MQGCEYGAKTSLGRDPKKVTTPSIWKKGSRGKEWGKKKKKKSVKPGTLRLAANQLRERVELLSHHCPLWARVLNHRGAPKDRKEGRFSKAKSQVIVKGWSILSWRRMEGFTGGEVGKLKRPIGGKK